jgi:hypothetical protein
MIFLLTEKATPDQLKKAAEDLDGYIKFVVDIERGILTVGGARHVEGEEILLKDRSRQSDLWGGGYDSESGEIDFDSMINIRPGQGNTSREVLDPEIRKAVEKIVREFLI